MTRKVSGDGAREQPALIHLQRSFSESEIVKLVCDVYNVKSTDIIARKSGYREARRVLMYCLSVFCRHKLTLTEMAGKLSVSVSGLTRARDRVRDEMPEDKALKMKIEEITTRLSMACNISQ